MNAAAFVALRLGSVNLSHQCPKLETLRPYLGDLRRPRLARSQALLLRGPDRVPVGIEELQADKARTLARVRNRIDHVQLGRLAGGNSHHAEVLVLLRPRWRHDAYGDE